MHSYTIIYIKRKENIIFDNWVNQKLKIKGFVKIQEILMWKAQF